MRLEEGRLERRPSPGGGRRRGKKSDRPFILITAIAGVCLLGFVSFVVFRGPSHHPGAGTAALVRRRRPRSSPKARRPRTSNLPALGGGGSVSLAAFRGRPVVLSFFASWCSPLPRGAGLRGRRGEGGRRKGSRARGRRLRNESSDAAAQRLLAAAHASYPVALDPDAKVATRYEVVALPVTYFLNANGKVVGATLGAQTVSSLTRWVARAESSR